MGCFGTLDCFEHFDDKCQGVGKQTECSGLWTSRPMCQLRMCLLWQLCPRANGLELRRSTLAFGHHVQSVLSFLCVYSSCIRNRSDFMRRLLGGQNYPKTHSHLSSSNRLAMLVL